MFEAGVPRAPSPVEEHLSFCVFLLALAASASTARCSGAMTLTSPFGPAGLESLFLHLRAYFYILVEFLWSLQIQKQVRKLAAHTARGTRGGGFHGEINGE